MSNDQEQEQYTDDTPMPWGKHKGKPLREVPAKYLLWVLNKPDPMRDYIEARICDITARAEEDRADHPEARREARQAPAPTASPGDDDMPF